EAVVDFHGLEMLNEELQPLRRSEIFGVEDAIVPVFVIPAAGRDVCSCHSKFCCSWHGKCTTQRQRKSNSMTQDILKGKWLQIKGDGRSWWGKLTEDDVDRIQGDTGRFIGKLQERYGYSFDQAQRELNDFLRMPEDQRRRPA